MRCKVYVQNKSGNIVSVFLMMSCFFYFYFFTPVRVTPEPRFVYQSRAAQKTFQVSWVSQSALNTDVFSPQQQHSHTVSIN